MASKYAMRVVFVLFLEILSYNGYHNAKGNSFSRVDDMETLTSVLEAKLTSLLAVVPNTEGKSRTYQTHGYVYEIYSIMQILDQLSDSAEAINPIVRSYVPKRGSRHHHHRRHHYVFDISDVSAGADFTYMELVLRQPAETMDRRLSVVFDDLENSRVLDSPLSHGVYSVYNISFAIPALKTKTSKMLQVKIHFKGENPLTIHQRSLHPLIVLYENTMSRIPSPVLTKERHVRSADSLTPTLSAAPETTEEPAPTQSEAEKIREVRDRMAQIMETESVSRALHCQRYRWILNLRIFPWRWLVAPRFYDAGKCAGLCPFPIDINHHNSTNYAFIKNIYHYQTLLLDEDVPRACCVPSAYRAVSILYIGRHMETVLQQLPQMMVTSCGCR